MASHTLQLKGFVRQIGDAIATLISLQSDLQRALNQADGVQAALLEFFSQPIPARLRQAVEPWQDLSPRVKAGFEPGATVYIAVEPKMDPSLSPQSCLNAVTVGYSGQSRYLCLAAWCNWADIEAAQRYQLGLYGVPSRPVSCRAVLRLPEKNGGQRDVQFSLFVLRPGEKAWNPSGPLVLPDDLKVDRERHPLLLFFFDTELDLEIRLDYINVYFA